MFPVIPPETTCAETTRPGSRLSPAYRSDRRDVAGHATSTERLEIVPAAAVCLARRNTPAEDRPSTVGAAFDRREESAGQDGAVLRAFLKGNQGWDADLTKGQGTGQLRTRTSALPSAGRRAIWFIVAECVNGPRRIRLKASEKSVGCVRSRFASAAYRSQISQSSPW